ncbi:MAG TPA: alpha/beta fold hydrolase [Nitrososphaeraceae archaeon]|nr:alpha/beta fold hydrolase [Nitrososphaeraceae archaeon]
MQNNNNVIPSLSSSSSSKSPYSLLDPNPSLLDENGNLVNDISKAATITTYRNGTITDGISKLILLIDSENPLQFSINRKEPDNLTNGTLSCLDQSNVNNLFSTTKVTPQNTNNGKSVVAAVYTPPDSFNQDKRDHRTINVNVNVSNANDDTPTLHKVPIRLYRPPVVLIHGVWTNSEQTWGNKSKFREKLENNGYKVFLADYSAHNGETFHPYAIPGIGNHGIDSLRTAIITAFNYYHNSCRNPSIAAAQVDVIAHSMGGLMARGFVQQPDYKRKDNFMKGSIHRLITIGTPHFGGHLSEFLYDHRDDWCCLDGTYSTYITPARYCKVEPRKLRTIYSDNYVSPIDKGAVEALIPGSDAYSHLYQTNVKSYAIAGSWKPNANNSHESQELDYKFITDNSGFSLDRDGFHDDNDLVVSVKSQLGGLGGFPYQIRQPDINYPPNDEDIPNESAIYPNTIHASFMIKHDKEIFSETNSPYIQEDVIRLLGSSDNNKFANAIGKGSSRPPSKYLIRIRF